MLEIRPEPPDTSAAFALDRLRDDLLALGHGTVGMYAPGILHEAAEVVAGHGGSALVVEMEPVDEVLDATLLALGFDRTRELLQLRRSLPVEAPLGDVTIATRPFRVGQDEEAWIALNNRAFDWHPEQGGWALADLVRREAEPWFDPDGFLLHEHEGRLLGFCWTKVHPATDDDPPLGEIYVIASDPGLHGRGLGRQLTLAGLAWLADTGIGTAMLYVESDNFAARHVYEDVLGFHVHLAHRWYARAVD